MLSIWVQLGSLNAPTQPCESRLSNEELVELEVGRERTPALKPTKKRLLRCIMNGIELGDEKWSLNYDAEHLYTMSDW